jgi:hypothetical protein
LSVLDRLTLDLEILLCLSAPRTIHCCWQESRPWLTRTEAWPGHCQNARGTRQCTSSFVAPRIGFDDRRQCSSSQSNTILRPLHMIGVVSACSMRWCHYVGTSYQRTMIPIQAFIRRHRSARIDTDTGAVSPARVSHQKDFACTLRQREQLPRLDPNRSHLLCSLWLRNRTWAQEGIANGLSIGCEKKNPR